MEPINNLSDEYNHYWETKMLFQNEDFNSWAIDEAFPGYYDSSSPDGLTSPAASKNIVSERNRRKKLNERLFALRSVVPNITKMDRASIIKDAIDYIQELQKQENRIQAEIKELEDGNLTRKFPGSGRDNGSPALLRSKKRTAQSMYGSTGLKISPIEVLELRVTYMGGKTLLVSLTCSKNADTMVRLCQVFESLNLKVLTANITAVSGRLSKNVFIEADEDEKEHLRSKIETAIAALNIRPSPMIM